tara:strand:+ start:498 stop:686 length:189 start_codon:yes stop_codon:yes gene_type:complete
MDNKLEKKIVKQILWILVAVLIYIFILAPMSSDLKEQYINSYWGPDDTEHIWIGGNGDTIIE